MNESVNMNKSNTDKGVSYFPDENWYKNIVFAARLLAPVK
jgi:hypothetical protein